MILSASSACCSVLLAGCGGALLSLTGRMIFRYLIFQIVHENRVLVRIILVYNSSRNKQESEQRKRQKNTRSGRNQIPVNISSQFCHVLAKQNTDKETTSSSSQLPSSLAINAITTPPSLPPSAAPAPLMVSLSSAYLGPRVVLMMSATAFAAVMFPS